MFSLRIHYKMCFYTGSVIGTISWLFKKIATSDEEDGAKVIGDAESKTEDPVLTQMKYVERTAEVLGNAC